MWRKRFFFFIAPCLSWFHGNYRSLSSTTKLLTKPRGQKFLCYSIRSLRTICRYQGLPKLVVGTLQIFAGFTRSAYTRICHPEVCFRVLTRAATGHWGLNNNTCLMKSSSNSFVTIILWRVWERKDKHGPQSEDVNLIKTRKFVQLLYAMGLGSKLIGFQLHYYYYSSTYFYRITTALLCSRLKGRGI